MLLLRSSYHFIFTLVVFFHNICFPSRKAFLNTDINVWGNNVVKVTSKDIIDFTDFFSPCFSITSPSMLSCPTLFHLKLDFLCVYVCGPWHFNSLNYATRFPEKKNTIKTILQTQHSRFQFNYKMIAEGWRELEGLG